MLAFDAGEHTYDLQYRNVRPNFVKATICRFAVHIGASQVGGGKTTSGVDDGI